ncbi:hypothetical protein [Mycobacterium sp.]|uniref:hypothetical protein n=1 Tax=Mycobacterium sp. TaxID=1785 RepID=UPI003D12DC1E
MCHLRAGWLLDSKHKLKPSTRARYQVVLDTALSKYAPMALGDISRRFVREWVADLGVDLAPASVHKTVGVLRQVLAMAVDDNRLMAIRSRAWNCPRSTPWSNGS